MEYFEIESTVSIERLNSNIHVHSKEKCKSFVFPRHYRNCLSRRINALVLINQTIKRAIVMAMHDFHVFSITEQYDKKIEIVLKLQKTIFLKK